MTSISAYEDRAILDLVAHLLGIATHDNINAAPSGWMRPPEERCDPPTSASGFNTPCPAVDAGTPEPCDGCSIVATKQFP
jgi:hypothetical protein